VDRLLDGNGSEKVSFWHTIRAAWELGRWILGLVAIGIVLAALLIFSSADDERQAKRYADLAETEFRQLTGAEYVAITGRSEVKLTEGGPTIYIYKLYADGQSLIGSCLPTTDEEQVICQLGSILPANR
jgi:hypothetical protein